MTDLHALQLCRSNEGTKDDGTDCSEDDPASIAIPERLLFTFTENIGSR